MKRQRYESAPDVEPVPLACGLVLMPEVKTRAKLPALITKALAQAAGYGPKGCVPSVVLSAAGGEPLIALPLRAFRVIAGLETPQSGPQESLRFPVPQRARACVRDGVATPETSDLGPDERRVLSLIAERLRMGASTYGPLDVDGDPRDWRHEGAEEALDLAVYLAAELLRGSR